jgi:hypothetical protein
MHPRLPSGEKAEQGGDYRLRGILLHQVPRIWHATQCYSRTAAGALTFRSILSNMLLMETSTTSLAQTLTILTRQARTLGWTDTEWATRAGVRKETLSRLRRRHSCDFETLRSLAQAVGARLGVLEVQRPDSTPDGHFPTCVNRDYEERLVELSVSGDLDHGRWAGMGPRFFMAGLAVVLASVRNRDRRGLLALAERLHPGASEVAVFNRWLEGSTLRPTRFLSLVDAGTAHAA